MKHNESERSARIAEIEAVLTDLVENNAIDAWFFNWADIEAESRAEAEQVLNSLLPGKWRFVNIWGNGTNVGEGWFADDEYDIYIALSSYSDEEVFIDNFDVYKKENVTNFDVEGFLHDDN